MRSLLRDLKDKRLPSRWAYLTTAAGVIISYFGDNTKSFSRSIFIAPDMSIEIRAGDIPIDLKCLVGKKINCFQDIWEVVVTVARMKWCLGPDENIPCHSPLFEPIVASQNIRCTECKLHRKRRLNRLSKLNKRSIKKNTNPHKLVKNIKRKYSRLQANMIETQDNLKQLQLKWASTSEEAIENTLSKLHSSQREAVRACFDAAKSSSVNGVRYTNAWILECILLRIKSRRAYEHIREHHILQVPKISTLNKYMKKMKPSYGFQDAVFELMKAKSLEMDPFHRRGTLVIDEMKVSKGFSFDRTSLKFTGLVDLAEYTPEGQATEQGDHALVFMFQPFVGQWVQTVGAFLSKGCANGTVLRHLALECTILLEQSGFYVDNITTDGATWNRKMWKEFGLKEEDNSCVHPCRNIDSSNDSSSESHERLYFCSDYSHLHKLFRNFLFDKDEVWTPDGVIKKKHWEAVIKLDGGKKNLGLKIAHKLTADHLNPKYWQKMNVGMAFEVFSERVLASMKIHKNSCPELYDCDDTIKFIERIQKVITAMTSRTINNSLKYRNEHYYNIINFRLYLKEWKVGATENNYSFLSDSTYTGFLVTLQTTIDIMDFLKSKCGYSYFMTSRLNQDALEAFFGMIRSACGSSDHPDSLLFIQVYRLLSFYSLVKPPKGSNVEGMGVLEILFDSDHLGKDENQLQWSNILDKIIERGNNQPKQCDGKDDHDYNMGTSDECVVEYMAGFIAYKCKKITSCPDCVMSVTKERGDLDRDKLIDQLSYGYLKYPSETLYKLISAIERAILKTVGGGRLTCYSFLEIADNILKEETSFVGCSHHQESLTKAVINIYTVQRAQVISKRYNEINDEARKEEQEFRKRSKLVESKNKKIVEISKTFESN